MKTYFFLLSVPALVVGLGWPLFAQTASAPRTTGKVLLLRSERLMDGDISRVGTQYRVRRGSSETWIAGDQAAQLFPDWEAAYQYMRARVNLGDPDERLRLARWCHLNGLTKHGLADATAALEMRPGHADSKQLVTLLERALQPAPARTAPAQAASPPRSPAAPAVDVGPEAAIAFKTRVQPILMNACINCHCAGRGGSFQLTRVAQEGIHVATEQNLAAVLSQANLAQVVLSPILIKAVSPHGGAAEPPLKSRQAVPFLTLANWLESTAVDNPHLLAKQAPPALLAPAVAAAPALPPRAAAPVPQATTPAPAVIPAVAIQPAPADATPPAQVPVAPGERSTPDPFDPAVFNQQQPRP